MNYKDTLNLPRTDFPMKANLPQREPAILERWESTEVYGRMQELRRDAGLFLLHDGPPYANGHIHIGHALNKILKDIVLKFQHLAGFRAPYRPGWDCHGLPIELEVEKKMGSKARAAASVLDVRRKCGEYADRFVDIQRDEFRRLGVLGEWDRPYLTKAFEYEATELRELATLLDGGYLYRGHKPVHWCASCRTALAEAEVEYADHTSKSVYVAFSVTDPTPALEAYSDRSPAIVIWTTTPWTLPANLAIAVNADFDYALVERGDGLVIVAKEMVDGLRDKLGLGDVVATIAGSDLEGAKAAHPWVSRKSLVILGEHVTLEAGTGCVHTAPGHGHDDYVVGARYGLEPYAPVGPDGRFTDEVPELEGMPVFNADSEIVDLLRSRDALLASEDYLHSYPHCWRCKHAIVFRATQQWFVAMEHGGLRERSLEEIDKVEWIPKWGRERIHGMILTRPDWCLSRQRAWGVPIVSVHCSSCGEVVCNGELTRHVAGLVDTEGSDVWFDKPLAELLPPRFACPACASTELEPETDILDVWFDSGVSHASVVESDFGAGTVADLYLEGSDQHRGWFHTSLLSCVGARQRAPYKAVLTHGFVLDGEGKKMSKSAGNVISPQEVIKQYGADILRLWVAAEDYRDDVNISDEILKRLADSYRRVRNTARNILGNLYDFDPDADRVAYQEMHELDRWALSRLGEFIDRCRTAYASYEFHVVYHALNNFCGVDLSSLYFDIVKDRLYCSPAGSLQRRSAQTAMYEILSALARIIAPVMSFTADEIWQQLPGAGRSDSVFLENYPVADPAWVDAELAGRWQRLWTLRGEVTKALEEKRKAGDIGHSLDARVVLSVGNGDREMLESLGLQEAAYIFIVSQLELSDSVAPGDIGIEVREPAGSKCSRCWNFSEAVGSHDDHPEACDRCYRALVS